MASAMILPISLSLLAEIVPTCSMLAVVSHGTEIFLSSATIAAVARSIPRLRSMGFIPAATDLAPSRTIACARTVAVVVPSPASSDVLLATSLTICAPMFCRASFNSISFATVTPSLVICGLP